MQLIFGGNFKGLKATIEADYNQRKAKDPQMPKFMRATKIQIETNTFKNLAN